MISELIILMSILSSRVEEELEELDPRHKRRKDGNF